MSHVSRIALFLEVAKQQSFAGAARVMGMTGPALSKQVQALEDQLGVKLLHRTTRQVKLTEEGGFYYQRARKALEDLAEAEQYIHDYKASPKGILKVNAPMSFGHRYLAQPIANFAKHYPDITMEVDFDDRKVDMLAEGYDVVVRIGALNDSSLIARKLAACPVLLCASAAFIKEHGIPSTPQQLTQFPAIIYTKQGNASEWRYCHEDDTQGSVSLQKHMGANNAEMMLQACLEGVGIALLPVFAAATYLQSGQLVQLLPEYHSYPQLNIYAIFPENRYLSTKVKLFLEHLSAASKALPWR